MPRHPPCALINLATKTLIKMLASTVQFSRNGRPPTAARRLPAPAVREGQHPVRAVRRPWSPRRSWPQPLPQDPTACQATRPPRAPFLPDPTTKVSPGVLGAADAGRQLIDVPPMSCPSRTDASTGDWTPTTRKTGLTMEATMLLRKEVIQPHLPVRLPCYDFVPIASPTFDGSLPYGLGHRLRVLPTFVT